MSEAKRCTDCLTALYWCEDQWVCLNCGAEFAYEPEPSMTPAQWRRFIVLVKAHTDPDGSLHQRTVQERPSALGSVVHSADLEAAEAAYRVFVLRWELLTHEERERALKEAHGA